MLASQDIAGQVRLRQTRSGHANVRTRHVSSRLGQVRSGQSQVRLRQDRTRSCQIGSDQIRSGQGLVRSC